MAVPRSRRPSRSSTRSSTATRTRAGDTLDAATFGKWGPALARRLDGDAELVLAGVSSDCCVLSTALAAADAGVHVRVVREACAGADDTAHARALAVMELYAPLVEIVGLANVLEALPPR